MSPANNSKRYRQSAEELEEFSKIHVMGATYDNIDSSQQYALVSVVGPDVNQHPLGENGVPIDYHGLVVWCTVSQDSGPEFERLRAKASKASGQQLDVYTIKTGAMAPLKFKQEDFKVENTSWADERVHALMQGVNKGNEKASQMFEERRQNLKAGTTTSAMVKEEMDRLQHDLDKMEEDKAIAQTALKTYHDRYMTLQRQGL